MKLLCDVCENAVASLICCANGAALCLSCDYKLAGNHQRMPVLSDPSQPALCDICQEGPSFFFCVEDRALLCRDCDMSIHSVNALVAKHRRFLLTGIQVGRSISPEPPPASAILPEQYITGMSTLVDGAAVMAMKKPAEVRAFTEATVMGNCGIQRKGPGEPSDRATKRPCKRAMAAASSPQVTCLNDINVGLCSVGAATEDALLSEKGSVAGGMTPATLRSYMSIPSSSDGREANAATKSSSNSTTISIRRMSAGRVVFVAPVLSSLRTALKQEINVSNSVISAALRQETEASIKSTNIHCTTKEGNISSSLNSDNIDSSNVTMDVDDCPPASSESVSDYLVSDVSELGLDELLTDLFGVSDSGASLSPHKEPLPY